MGRKVKRGIAITAGVLLPTVVWWFVTLDVSSPFQGPSERLFWTGLTGYLGWAMWLLAYRD